MTSVRARVDGVREQIAAAAGRAGRDPGGIRLVGVTKDVPVARIAEAAGAGIADFGENRAQELARKMAEMGTGVRWHFLGAIQTNKVRLLDGVCLLHGLVRAREAEALHRRGERTGCAWDVLVEVNVAGEATKRGVVPGAIGELLDALTSYPLVRPCGLMIVAPQVENHEDVRWVFERMRQLRDAWSAEVPALRELSMGMSDDFETAVEEGATIVRIGRAIFGRDRPKVAPETGREN